MQNITNKLSRLFTQWSGNEPDTIVPLPPSGSERKYFRLSMGDLSAIGAWNPVVEENEAFLHFTEHFLSEGLNVPAIYGIDPGKNIYLLEDLGNDSLFGMMEKRPDVNEVPEKIIDLYRESLQQLVRFQVVAGKGLDFGYCYPHPSFDARSMKWDLNYFKYYFLKLHVTFHEGRMEDDFETLVAYLSEAEPDYFMFRDFQSRNILIKDDRPYFIDYQGGRKGPLQYDVASLLFQVKADLPFGLRERLFDDYLKELSKYININKESFKKYYYGFVLMRLLQVLGAYGFRGLIEKKPHFMVSIPFALKNLEWWLKNMELGISLPELIPALESLTEINQYKLPETEEEQGKLTLRIKSFSYQQGIPADTSGNGGGFVFDCRALPNPGREERYRSFNGKDKIIIDYLKDEPAVIEFLEDTEKLVSRSAENYLARGFNHLSVNFGCTGGQHRSVYCAQTMAERLKKRFKDVIFNIEHLNI